MTTMDYPQHPITAATGRDAAVEAIQTQLRAAGASDLEVDGVFGSQTENAVRLFQAQHSDFRGMPLVVDGVVGSLTWAALMNQKVPVAAARTSPILEKTLDVARSQIGVREVPRDSNRGPQVEQYLASVGLGGGYAWCASFVYWCFHQASEGGANPCPRTGGVHALWNEAVAGGRLHYTPRQVSAAPELVRPGQLFFLDSGGGLGHMGFIEEVQGAYLTTIEGNTDASGTREGGGVYRRVAARKIAGINLGVADVTQTLI